MYLYPFKCQELHDKLLNGCHGIITFAFACTLFNAMKNIITLISGTWATEPALIRNCSALVVKKAQVIKLPVALV
jgi:hypothetical protein